MLPFSKHGPMDPSERKALLSAVAASLLFIAVVAVVHPLSFRRARLSHDLILSTPIPLTKLFEPSEPPRVDSLARFRVIPREFQQVDFTNYTYGLYQLSDGQKIELTLSNAELQLPDNLGSFMLKDVYYRDVTGDRKAEAIAWLSHVQCEGPCDGGANIFYIYTAVNGKLKPIWQYETGSYAYGCGLKSFTIADKQLLLELFGHCSKESIGDRGPSRFVVEDSTFILLVFTGRRFEQSSLEIVGSRATNVKNYEPKIRIF